MELIRGSGILDFSPLDRTKKHRSQSVWKRTAIIKTRCDLSLYYSWFLKSRYNLELNKPLRGSHITIIADRMDSAHFDMGSKIFNGKNISFSYDPSDISSNGEHWWMKISCDDAENIRDSMGLSRIPYFDFHLTIGYASEKNISHSQYIWRCMEKFNQ